ncbi:MAG: alpha/beta fold hydrolase [Archangiaceae bacterium]|nr:alpha/beta fold hydrolase [Archangiaceae bacterium]
MPDAQTLIPAVDGFRLAATAYAPAGPSRGTVVLNSAMGVKQEYYQPFARWLATQGFTAVTWDYRGVAASRPGPLGRISLRDWAEQDMEGVLQWSLARGQPVFVIGHSLGTQLLGLCPSAPRLTAVVGVASQSGDWRNWPFPYDVGMLMLASVILPSVSQVFGKLPKGLMGEEVPKGPIIDWARWIRSKGYLLSEGEWIKEQYARLTCPIAGISIDDDKYAPKSSVDRLYAIYRAAPVTRVHLVPKEHGVKTIGHFGPFRRQFEGTLWPLMARPLEEALAPRLQAG